MTIKPYYQIVHFQTFLSLELKDKSVQSMFIQMIVNLCN